MAVTSHASAPWRRIGLPVVVVLAAGAALGAAVGGLWWVWWSPGFDGTVYATQDGARWLPEPFDPGFADTFTGTAQYVILGAAAGLLLGVAVAFAMRRRPVPGLAVATLGAVVAAAVMYLVGTAPSPPDPQSLATEQTIGDTFPGNLEVVGWTPYLVWPVLTWFGYAAFMVLTASASTVRAKEQDPEWLKVTPARSEPSPPQ